MDVIPDTDSLRLLAALLIFAQDGDTITVDSDEQARFVRRHVQLTGRKITIEVSKEEQPPHQDTG